MKKIKVLVSSCACNQKYASLVEAVVKNNQIDATVEKVDDIMEVMQYLTLGVSISPCISPASFRADRCWLTVALAIGNSS